MSPSARSCFEMGVEVEDIAVPALPGPLGARIFRPAGDADALPTVLYLPGAEWSFDPPEPRDRLLRELARRARTAIVLPTSAEPGGGLEQAYEVLAWVARSGARRGLDPSRIALGGDAGGGALAAGLALAVKERCGPMLTAQFLLCPGGLFVPAVLGNPTNVLTGLPPTLVIVAEVELPPDDGCAYAAALLAAGVRAVAVRYLGTRHGFPWSDLEAPAARAVVDQAAQFLVDAFWLSPAAGIAPSLLPRRAHAKDQGKPQGV